jgi:hypothetical protein
MRHRVLLLIAGAVFLAAPAPAQPKAPDGPGSSGSSAAEELIKAGIELRKRGDDQQALPYFERAFAIEQTPRATAQLGLVEYALGRWVRAEEHLSDALSTADPWVAKHRGVLESALAQVGSRLGSLEVSANVDGAELFVDGEAKGKLPLSKPLRLAAGAYTVELSLPGFHDASRRVQIAAREVARETVKLEPINASKSSPVAPSRGVEKREPAPNLESPDTRAGAGRKTRFGTLKWVAAGTSGTLLVGAAVLAIVREQQVSSYNDDSTCGGTNRSNTPDCNTRIDRANTLGTLALGSLIGGVVIGATSGVLFVMDGPRRDVACGAGAQLLSVTCGTRF